MRLLAKRTNGTYVDHSIAIDCAKQVVADCSETVELKLNMRVFNYGVGDDGGTPKVQERKEMCRQTVGKCKRKSNKMSAEKQTEKRRQKRSGGNGSSSAVNA